MSDPVHDLYVLDCGTIVEPRDFMYLHSGYDPLNVPISAYLITHPRGNVLVDTGLPGELVTDRSHWPPGLDFMKVTMAAGNTVRAQISAAGVDPDSIEHVIISHLHLDHVGGLGNFPNATVHVHRAEWDYAHSPDWFSAGIYLLNDIDKPAVSWSFHDLTEKDRSWDLYGDGRIQVLFTPGHSAGHVSVLTTLEEKTVLIAGDIASVEEHYRNQALGFWVDLPALDRSLKYLHRIEAEYAVDTVVFAHDDAQSASLNRGKGPLS